MAAEETQTCNRDARKLETFCGVHAQQPHGHLLRRNPVPVVLGHIDRHALFGENLSDLFSNPVLRIEASHLRPLVSRLFPAEKPFGDAVRFCLDAHALPHVRRQPLPSCIFRQQNRVLVIGRRARSTDHVCSEASRKGNDLGRVAVVDLQDGRPARRFDAKLFPHRPFTPFVDGLNIVIDDHQRLRARVHHLGRKCEPLRLEIVCLVDQDSVVLLHGDVPLIDSLDDL